MALKASDMLSDARGCVLTSPRTEQFVYAVYAYKGLRGQLRWTFAPTDGAKHPRGHDAATIFRNMSNGNESGGLDRCLDRVRLDLPSEPAQGKVQRGGANLHCG